MLGDIEGTPASARPKYGLEASAGEVIATNPVKKAGMLALLALASSLLLVIPDNDDEEQYALTASSEDADEADGSDVGPTTDTESPSAPVREVASETGVSSEADTARLALATEAAMAGAEHSLGGSGVVSYADRVGAAGAAAEVLSRPSSTVATTAPAAPTTAKRVVTTTTTAPAESSSSSSETTASEDTSTSAADDGQTTSTAAETSTTDAGSSSTAADVTTAETAETTDTAGSETTVPETTVPETTAAPTTAAPTTAAPTGEPGWVDTGNGVMVPPVLLAIRYCESRDNYTAANPSSSARGGYQFLTGSWAGYGHKARYGVNQAHLATPAQQDEAALITWQRDGTRPWNASKSCWSKRI